MKTVIMAGGEGTRLRPLTCNRPKPMVPIVNKPVMEHIVELLKKYELKDIAVTLQYMPDLIQEYFDDGSEFGVKMQYYTEHTPLGTAGSVKNAESFLDDTFLVISGDALTDINLRKAMDFHLEKGSIATLILKKVDIPLEYGVVVTNDDGRITRFLEKPSWGEVFSDTVNTGIYILSPEVLGYYRKNEMFDFSKDLFPILLKENKPLYGYITDDYWCDVGDLRAYLQSHRDVLDGKVQINIPGKELNRGVWIDEEVEIDENADIKSPCLIGKNTAVRDNSVIEKYTVIGDSCVISGRCGLKKSIIWKNCTLDKNVQLRGSIICNKVHLNNNVSTFEYSVIGDETIVKENAIIKPNIKIWPDKMIDIGAEVNTNLVWGSKFTRSIFGQRGIAGEINVDITPEYASKLGAAFGAVLKGKGRVGVSCDDSYPAEMLKISFISGLLSSGMQIMDFGEMLLPATRSAVRFYSTQGGIHISTSSNDLNRLFIDFLDKNGCNISRSIERKIENIFVREDFSRCEGDHIKKIIKIPDYDKFHMQEVINNVKSDKINKKVVLNSRSKLITDTITELLEELDCNVETTNLNLVDAPENVKYFREHIKTGDYDLGVSIEDTSEKMTLVDENGRILTEDMFIALTSIILFKTLKGRTVVVPVSASQVVEKIADENAGKVIRSKTSHQDIMSSIIGKEIREDMLDQFTMYFDAMSALVRILDFMTVKDQKLSGLVDMIPDFHINKNEVACPWNAKGKVIRRIMEEHNGEKIETLEGVKVYKDKGWVLVLPDAEQPLCRVISESYSEEFAEELTNVYMERIRQISRE